MIACIHSSQLLRRSSCFLKMQAVTLAKLSIEKLLTKSPPTLLPKPTRYSSLGRKAKRLHKLTKISQGTIVARLTGQQRMKAEREEECVCCAEETLKRKKLTRQLLYAAQRRAVSNDRTVEPMSREPVRSQEQSCWLLQAEPLRKSWLVSAVCDVILGLMLKLVSQVLSSYFHPWFLQR